MDLVKDDTFLIAPLPTFITADVVALPTLFVALPTPFVTLVTFLVTLVTFLVTLVTFLVMLLAVLVAIFLEDPAKPEARSRTDALPPEWACIQILLIGLCNMLGAILPE